MVLLCLSPVPDAALKRPICSPDHLANHGAGATRSERRWRLPRPAWFLERLRRIDASKVPVEPMLAAQPAHTPIPCVVRGVPGGFYEGSVNTKWGREAALLWDHHARPNDAFVIRISERFLIEPCMQLPQVGIRRWATVGSLSKDELDKQLPAKSKPVVGVGDTETLLLVRVPAPIVSLIIMGEWKELLLRASWLWTKRCKHVLQSLVQELNWKELLHHINEMVVKEQLLNYVARPLPVQMSSDLAAKVAQWLRCWAPESMRVQNLDFDDVVLDVEHALCSLDQLSGDVRPQVLGS